MGSSDPRVVLVVDDDPDLRALAKEYLVDCGYRVLDAEHGEGALVLLRREPGINLLLTDIVMPGHMDGFELAHQAKQIRPNLRILYTSGRVPDVPLPWGEKGIGYGHFLPKPWRLNELGGEVERALNQAA